MTHLADRLGLSAIWMEVLVFSRLCGSVLSGRQIDRLVLSLFVANNLTFDHRLLICEIQIESICQIDFCDTWLSNTINLVCLLHGYSGTLIFVHLLAEEQILECLIIWLAVVWFRSIDTMNMRLYRWGNWVMLAQPATPFNRIMNIKFCSHQALVVSRVHHSDRMIYGANFTWILSQIMALWSPLKLHELIIH